MEEKNLIFRKSEEQYGEKFRDHYLEIYKIYVGTADKISAQRQSANSFFLSINTAIVGLVGYLQSDSSAEFALGFYFLISVAGMLICYAWYRLVQSYRQINSGKFKIIHYIEQGLPIAPYDAEWDILGRGKDTKKYLPFTHIEILVPWIFFGLYIFIFLRMILQVSNI